MIVLKKLDANETTENKKKENCSKGNAARKAGFQNNSLVIDNIVLIACTAELYR